MDSPVNSNFDYVDIEDGRFEQSEGGSLNESFSENGNGANIGYIDTEDNRYEQGQVGSLNGSFLENEDSFSEVTSENYDPTSVEVENENTKLLQEQVYAEYSGPMKQISKLLDEILIGALSLQEATIEVDTEVASIWNNRLMEKAKKLLIEADE